MTRQAKQTIEAATLMLRALDRMKAEGGKDWQRLRNYEHAYEELGQAQCDLATALAKAERG